MLNSPLEPWIRRFIRGANLSSPSNAPFHVKLPMEDLRSSTVPISPLYIYQLALRKLAFPLSCGLRRRCIMNRCSVYSASVVHFNKCQEESYPPIPSSALQCIMVFRALRQFLLPRVELLCYYILRPSQRESVVYDSSPFLFLPLVGALFCFSWFLGTFHLRSFGNLLCSSLPTSRSTRCNTM